MRIIAVAPTVPATGTRVEHVASVVLPLLTTSMTVRLMMLLLGKVVLVGELLVVMMVLLVMVEGS